MTDDPIDALVDSFARQLARARFGPGVDMGGKHNPLPSERIIATRMVEEAALVFGRMAGEMFGRG